MPTLSNTLRLYAFAIGTGAAATTPVTNQGGVALPVALPFVLTETVSTPVETAPISSTPGQDPGVLWLTEEGTADEINSTGTSILPFSLPSVLASSVNVLPIVGNIRTRQFQFGTMHKKRFSRASVDVVLYEDSTADVSINTINPDAETKLLEFSTSTQEDYVRRVRVAKQGFGAELIINTTQGRASIRGATLEAVIPGTTTKSED